MDMDCKFVSGIARMSGFTAEESKALSVVYEAAAPEIRQALGSVTAKVHSAMLHFQKGTHQHFKREHKRKKVEGYRILNDIEIGTTIFSLFEDDIGSYSDNRYLAADWCNDGPKAAYRNHFYGEYPDVLMNYYERINHKLEEMAYAKDVAHNTAHLLYGRDCIDKDDEQDYQNSILVLLPVMTCPGYEYADNQLFYAQSGPGCKPTYNHQATIYGTLLATGEKWAASRTTVFGILKPELVPPWAAQQVSKIEAAAANEEKAHGEEEKAWA